MYNSLKSSTICTFVLVGCSLFAQEQPSRPVSPPQSSAPAQQPPSNEVAPSVSAPPQRRPTTPQASEHGQRALPAKPPKTPKEKGWEMLESAGRGDKTSERASAISVLGLVQHDSKAVVLAEQALNDDKPEVRTAAVTALGDLQSRKSIPKLRKALADQDPLVVLAAAHSLERMHDKSAYELYYEVLYGERKTGRGLIASQKAMLTDPKKMAMLGFQEGIGFIPFAGIGWGAIKQITKDDSSPIRAAAAKVLANDPDPATTQALTDAVGDKSWLVRAAALGALARRGNPSALNAVVLAMSDENESVRLTAAATVVRLTTIKAAAGSIKGKGGTGN